MNKSCPKCGSNYNITSAHAGRTFACKNCGSNLIVGEGGIQLRDELPAVQPQAAAVVADFGHDDSDGPVRRSRPSNRERADIGDYLAFRRFLTPVVIQIVFWIMTAVIVIMGILGIVSARSESMLAGVGMILFGPLVVRIYCELIILSFRFYDVFHDMSRSAAEMARNSRR